VENPGEACTANADCITGASCGADGLGGSGSQCICAPGYTLSADFKSCPKGKFVKWEVTVYFLPEVTEHIVRNRLLPCVRFNST
jgi:hypothetical protein